MIAGLCVDVCPLIGEAALRGGHVRVGLEDAPLGTPMSNVAWVEKAVRIIRSHGVEPATIVDVRHELSLGATSK
jgi:uncharacterized protein (DUF849 family)